MEKFFSADVLNNVINLAIGYAPKIIGALLMLIFGLWLISIITNVIKKQLKRLKVDESLAPFLTSLVSALLKVILFLSVASMFGFEITSFVAVLGAMAFAVGMALQGSLGNFAGGVLILLLKPFKVGDLINAMGHLGTVEEVQIFATTLRTPENKKIILPNGALQSSAIENISANNEICVFMTFAIGFHADIDQARAVVKEVDAKCPHLVPGMETVIQVLSLGDSSVNLAVRPWTTAEHYWDVHFYYHEAIKKAFTNAGISIPIPKMEVSVINK